MKSKTQPWLANPIIESIFILSPAVIPVILVYAFKDYFNSAEVSTIWWVILVLGIDVSHVYSTLFRMYWDKETFRSYKHLLIVIPLVAFVIGLLLHNYNALLFWRALAYIAVYHFVRQQYGFMRLYSRKENASRLSKLIDTVAIYSATIYPLLHWHLHATDKLVWFVKGDFIKIPLGNFTVLLNYIYISVIAIYLIKEVIASFREKQFNVPKNFIVAGTFLSWYVGIVAFQGDLIFTFLNVIAHGVPYLGLIWIYGEKKAPKQFHFNWKGASFFITALIMLAYIEENFWDAFIWNEHAEVFPLFSSASLIINNELVISVLVSLLVLPQVTHYVLDGFIWRFSSDDKARI